MTFHESPVIYSKHGTRGIFIFITVFSLLLPAALNLSLHLYPETGDKNITVKFEYKGAFEKDIEKLINKLEQGLSSLPGLKSVLSVSEAEKGSVYCSFLNDRDYDEAYMEVRDCVKRIYTLFPENVQRPVLLKSGINNFPVFAASFQSDAVTDSRELERSFEEIKGCSEAETGGESRREITIIPDTEKIHSSAFSMKSIINKIRNENCSVLITSPGRRQIKAGEKISGADDIRNILLSPGNGIDDYTSVILRKKETDSEGRINGENRIIVYAMKEGESSVVEVCRKLAEKTEEAGGIVIFSRGAEIEKALCETAFSVAAGITAVIITALVYFRNISFSFLVILNILFSVTSSAAFLNITHHSLDIITLSGMAVVSGLAIDNSIIFIEKYRNKNGNIASTVFETIYPLLFSFLTTAVVFLPVLFASLKLKIMFSGMAVSVSSGLAASFLFTFYFSPLFLIRKARKQPAADSNACFIYKFSERSCFLKKGKQRHKKTFSDNSCSDLLTVKYFKLLKVMTLNKYIPLLLLVLFSTSAFFMFSETEYNPLNFEKKDSLTFIMEFPSGSSFRHVQQKARSVEKEVLEYLNSSTANKENNKSLRQEEKTQLVVKTEKERVRFDLKVSDRQFLGPVRRKIDEISRTYPDIYFHYPVSESSGKNYDITLYSNSIINAASDAYRLGRRIEASDSRLKTVYHFKKPAESLIIVFKTCKAFSSSISPGSASEYIYTLLSAPVISKYYSNGNERDIRFGSDDTYTPDKLKKTAIPCFSAGDEYSTVSLNDISEFTSDFPPGRIYHKNRQRSLSMSVSGIEGKRGAYKMKTLITEFDFCNGCRGEGGVLYHKKQEEEREIILLLILSVFFIISVLVMQFESVKIPLFITAGIPPSFLLPLAVMKITGIDFTASTALALLLSSGICVNNAILVLSPFKGKSVITKMQAAESLSGKTGALLTVSLTTFLSIFPLILAGPDSLLAPFSIVLSSGIAGSLILLPLVAAACCRD